MHLKLSKSICTFLLIALSCFQNNLFSQLSDDAYIALITCRPGDEIFNSWGHTGIRVYDPTNNIDHIFNYGMFSFEEPNFLPKFLKGKLLYWVGTENYNSFYYKYDREKRSIIEQKLNLDKAQKRKIFQALNKNLRAENRKYLYDFFFDNCSTRPRDIILKQISIQTNIKNTSDKTFRELLDPYILHQPWIDWGIDIIIGSIADKKATISEAMFLPEQLMQQFDNISLVNKSLVAEKNILLDHEIQNGERKKSTWFKPIFLMGLLLMFEIFIFIKRKTYSTKKWLNVCDKLWYTLFAVASLAITFMWFGTNHISTKLNLNLLWLSPLFIFILFSNSKKLKIAAILSLIATLIGSTFIQEIHIVSIMAIIIMLIKLTRNLSVYPISKTD